jgi:hypothetical protein
MKTVFAALILLGAAAAQASPGGQDLARDQVYWRHDPAGLAHRGDNDRDDRRGADPGRGVGADPAPGAGVGRSSDPPATSAPEMDPGSAVAAFALLLGGLAVVGGNRSAGKKQA